MKKQDSWLLVVQTVLTLLTILLTIYLVRNTAFIAALPHVDNYWGTGVYDVDGHELGRYELVARLYIPFCFCIMSLLLTARFAMPLLRAARGKTIALAAMFFYCCLVYGLVVHYQKQTFVDRNNSILAKIPPPPKVVYLPGVVRKK